MNELYKKIGSLGFDPTTSCVPRQRSTTCATSEVTDYHLNVIDEQLNVYSAGMNF